VAITFDGAERKIYLDGTPTVSVRAIYSAWVDWIATAENLKWLPAFRTIADPPTVPVYAFLTNDWCVVPVGGAYTLIINDGFLDTDSMIMEVFCPAAPGPEPRIRYDKPAVALGYSTSSPQQSDIDAIRAVTDALEIVAGRVVADLRAIRGQALTGTGVPGDSFRPV
jgi:hypothetical protein